MPCLIDFMNTWELRYQGAESKIYYGTHSNNRCVIKHRFSKNYRHPTLDKKLTKERTKRERRMIEKIKTKSEELSPYMPKVVWSDDNTILMTEITDSISLFDFFEQEPEHSFKVTTLIGKCIAELHNLGIIHGDLTTSNLLLLPRMRSDSEDTAQKKARFQVNFQDNYIVVPIDFGLATGSHHPEERAVDLYVLERALLSTHFSDSTFFQSIFDAYLANINESASTLGGKDKIVERLREVRARGRKSDYSNDIEA